MQADPEIPPLFSLFAKSVTNAEEWKEEEIPTTPASLIRVVPYSASDATISQSSVISSYQQYFGPSCTSSASSLRSFSTELRDQLSVINVSALPALSLPTLPKNLRTLSFSTLASFYENTWEEEMEWSSITATGEYSTTGSGKVPRTRRAKKKHDKCVFPPFLTPGIPLSREVWMEKVPHIVWGSASTLPSSTRLDKHPCISPLHAKLILITGRHMARYFLKTFPLIEEAQSFLKPYSYPYYIVINYSVNPVYINSHLISRGRSSVLQQGDIFSFLESALDQYGGIFLSADKKGKSESDAVSYQQNDKIDALNGAHQDLNSGSLNHREGIIDVDSSLSDPMDSDLSTSVADEPASFSSSGLIENQDVTFSRSEYCQRVAQLLLSSLSAELEGQGLRLQEEYMVIGETDFLNEQWSYRKIVDEASFRWSSFFQGTYAAAHRVLEWRPPVLTRTVLRTFYRFVLDHEGFKQDQVMKCGFFTPRIYPELSELGETDEEESLREERLVSPIMERWMGIVQFKPVDEKSNHLHAVSDIFDDIKCESENSVLSERIKNDEKNFPCSLSKNLFHIGIEPALLPVYAFVRDTDRELESTPVTRQHRLLVHREENDTYYYSEGKSCRSFAEKKKNESLNENLSHRLASELWVDLSSNNSKRRKRLR